MKRECLQKFLSGFFVFCITLSFSIVSFADPFTGAYMTTETDPVTGQVTTVIKDVNPTGQTFSGQNVIEVNAYNNAPTLTNNTFNGSTDINPDFTSITSTGNSYNGSVDINYDGLGGTLDSNGDRFQSTTVTSQQSDISISNGTFNGTTNINANSVSLGSISQMDELLKYCSIVVDNFTHPRESSTAQTVTCNYFGVSASYDLGAFGLSGTTWYCNFSGLIRRQINNLTYLLTIVVDNIINPRVQDTSAVSGSIGGLNYSYTLTRVLQPGYAVSTNNKYCNFSGMVLFYLNSIAYHFSNWYDESCTDSDPNYKILNVSQSPVYLYKGRYIQYSYTPNTDVLSNTTLYFYNSFYAALHHYFEITVTSYLNANIAYMADTWYRWYSPRIDPSSNYFWYVYNTDTAQMESINLAGLMYDISWYLGQMYVLQSASQSLDNMADQVEEITDTLEEAEQKENAVISSISSGINNFAPDIQSISAFSALSWCSNYLQQMFVALGVYGTVIMVGLLLGVCMQFIGYFRYK